MESYNSELLHNLGNPVRLKILELLAQGEKNVSELLELIEGLQQGRLSSHLGWLRMWGYVYTHRSGRYVYYGIRDPRIMKILDALSSETEDSSPKQGAWCVVISRRCSSWGIRLLIGMLLSKRTEWLYPCLFYRWGDCHLCLQRGRHEVLWPPGE